MTPPPTEEKVSDQLERWLTRDGPKTLGGLVDVFGPGSFALIFVLLLSPAALPLPTGGATHVLEVIAMLLALELIAGRREVWLPARWKRTDLGEGRREKFIAGLLKRIRWLERFARPRWRWVFQGRLSAALFGAVVFGLSLTAFLAPPFSGLDTLPALGVVLLALGVLVEDVILAAVGLVVGILGVAATLLLSSLVVKGIGGLF